MSARIRLAAALLAATALTSCTVGNPNPPKIDTGVGNSSPASTPTPTPTPTVTDSAAPAPGTPQPAAPTGPGAASTRPAGALPGQPIPDAELAGDRTAKQMRFVASRLDAYLKANGVPGDWATSGPNPDCFDHIDVLYTQAESAAWDNDILVTHMCHADGSYSLRGWSQTGTDQKYNDANSGLDYESGKGFLSH